MVELLLKKEKVVQSVVQTIASELNSQPIEVDILEADVPSMILDFVDKLAE